MDEVTLKHISRELEVMNAQNGFEMAELLDISDELRRLLTWMVRKRQFSVNDLAKRINVDASAARGLINTMLRKGFIKITETEDVERYSTTMNYVPKYKVPNDIWKALED